MMTCRCKNKCACGCVCVSANALFSASGFHQFCQQRTFIGSRVFLFAECVCVCDEESEEWARARGGRVVMEHLISCSLCGRERARERL